ncbi:MAG: Smr/MutS family protein [Gemmatimonadota bacterium]|nr:Smr/MutS family protein [Gemmatimonadota bacterium]
MKTRTDPDEAGQDDFERRMADVDRLPEPERLVEETVVREVVGARRPRGRGSQAGPAPGPPGRIRIGALDGLNRRQAVALRRGGIAIDARLDLHGFTRRDAARKVAAFLAQSAHRGLRCVLVITGQGRSDPLADARGVLSSGLEDWLNEPATRPFVLACVPARGRHGGQGAFYVLLRRGGGGR